METKDQLDHLQISATDLEIVAGAAYRWAGEDSDPHMGTLIEAAAGRVAEVAKISMASGRPATVVA